VSLNFIWLLAGILLIMYGHEFMYHFGAPWYVTSIMYLFGGLCLGVFAELTRCHHERY
jgi:hypothetical protein